MRIRNFTFVFSALVLILAFQNCSSPPPVSFTQASSKATDETDENGRPYDGKIFILTGDVCPDKTRIRARIVVKSPQSADLVRFNCNEINPVALGPNEFQINPANSSELQYQNQTYVNELVGNKIDVSLAKPDFGFCFLLVQDFGTPPDDGTSISQSILQIFEDGKPIGPAHTLHPDIRDLGMGRFSHWLSGGLSTLRFSASDNTDPRTNGRTYTWDILN